MHYLSPAQLGCDVVQSLVCMFHSKCRHILTYPIINGRRGDTILGNTIHTNNERATVSSSKIITSYSQRAIQPTRPPSTKTPWHSRSRHSGHKKPPYRYTNILQSSHRKTRASTYRIYPYCPSGPSIKILIPFPSLTSANAFSASSNLTLPVMSSLTLILPPATRSMAVW